MTTTIGARPVKDNLLMNVDAGSISSLRGRKSNLLSWENWEDAGAFAGNVSAFNGYPSYVQNGSTAENSRSAEFNPWGDLDIVWKAVSTSPGAADGGWNTSQFSIDSSKLYRFSVWVKALVTGQAGFYLGPRAYDAGGVLQTIQYRKTASSTSNPYIMINNDYSQWDENTIGTWYLVIGHVWPAGTPQESTGEGNHPNTGVWKLDGTNVANTISNDFIWEPDTKFSIHRTYQYYSNITNGEMFFFQPRVDVVDGSEPSLEDLLNNTGNLFKDISGNKNHLKLSSHGSPSFDPSIGPRLRYETEYNGYLDMRANTTKGYIFSETFSGVTASSFLQNDHTMEIWARIKDFSPSGGSGATVNSSLMGFGTKINNSSPLSGIFYQENQIFYRIYRATDITYDLGTFWSAAGISESEWHQYCYTFDYSTGSLKFYLDGVLTNSGSTIANYQLDTLFVSDTVGIGGEYNSAAISQHSDADIAIARMYTKELSAAEVLQNFNSAKGRFQL